MLFQPLDLGTTTKLTSTIAMTVSLPETTTTNNLNTIDESNSTLPTLQNMSSPTPTTSTDKTVVMLGNEDEKNFDPEMNDTDAAIYVTTEKTTKKRDYAEPRPTTSTKKLYMGTKFMTSTEKNFETVEPVKEASSLDIHPEGIHVYYCFCTENSVSCKFNKFKSLPNSKV